VRSIATTSIHSIPAVDASPSGPKNGCLPVPGLTPFAGRLRPVGAVGFGIVDVASAHPERRWVLFRAKQWLPRLYQGSRPSLADYAPLGLSDSELWTLPQRLSAVDASPSGPKNGCSAVPGLTPFAGRLRPVGAVEIVVVGIFTTSSIRSRLAVDASPSGPNNGCSAVPGLTPFAGRLGPVGAVGLWFLWAYAH